VAVDTADPVGRSPGVSSGLARDEIAPHTLDVEGREGDSLGKLMLPVGTKLCVG
jgi:hypothetical protein